MRLQAGTQQGSESLGGVGMSLMKSVPVVISGLLAPAVAHGLVVKTPFRQTSVWTHMPGAMKRSSGRM